MIDGSEIDVIMSVYKKNSVEEVKAAVNSIINQTITPSMFIIFIDGPILLEVREFLDKISQFPLVKIVASDTNVGRGLARNNAASFGSSEFIALMDADDISRPKRLEQQLKYAREKKLDICGSHIEEFSRAPGDLGRLRKTPISNFKIRELVAFRSPINHVTTLIRRDIFSSIGGYRDLKYVEDWDLFVRAINAGAILGTYPQVLVDVKQNVYRRFGFGYFREEVFLLWNALNLQVISFKQFSISICLRFIKLIIPRFLVPWIYSILRYK